MAQTLIMQAGISLDKILGSDASVFMGSSCRDYTDLLLEDLDKTELYQATGTGATMLANRISYFLDLKGPSVTIDTGMSICHSIVLCLTRSSL
jgi:acyl transferase domain-containing protein